MQSRSWSCYRTFIFGVNGLISFGILGLYLSFNVFRKWGFSQLFQFFPEFGVGAVVKEPQSSSAGCCIIYNLSNQALIISKIKFVTNSYFPCRVNKNIP